MRRDCEIVMAKFNYEGYDKKSVLQVGTLEAKNYSAAYEALQFQGLTVVKLSSEKAGFFKILSEYFLKFKIGERWRAIFFRELSVMLGVMNLHEALQTILKSERNLPAGKILEEISAAVEIGETFTSALRQREIIFGNDVIQSIEIGETSGSLQTITAQLADRLERNYTTRRKVSGAMYYPVVVLIVATIAAIIMANMTLPVFEDFYREQGGELPTITIILFGCGKFLTEHFFVVIFFIAAGIFLFATIYHSVAQVRYIIGKIQWQIKIFREIELRNFFGRIHFLLESGITLNDAMKFCMESSGNLYIKNFLREIKSDIEVGETFSKSIKSRIKKLSPLYLGLIVSGEASGELSEMLSRCEKMADFEIDEILRELPARVEVYGTLFAGIIVGALVFSIVLPILNMTSLF